MAFHAGELRVSVLGSGRAGLRSLVVQSVGVCERQQHKC